MRAMIASFLLLLSIAPAYAEVMGPVRLHVTVVSVDKTWARVVYAGKRVRVPSRSLASTKVTGVQEASLTRAEYEQMKTDYFLGSK